MYMLITFVFLVEKLMENTEDTHDAAEKSLYESI